MKGSVLLSYLVDPFLVAENDLLFNKHTNYWECLQIAKTFLNMGYRVDVISGPSFPGDQFIPKRDYSFFIDMYKNMDRIANVINKDCIKIYHITRAHWMFHNAAEYKRCLDIQQRKKVTIKPRRQVQPNWGIDLADYGITIGNEFTISTYKYAKKPIFRVPISTCAQFPWNGNKKYVACKRNFLWLGGEGLAHKGLDLVLDAFKETPEFNLFVCGEIRKEDDFEKAYFKELYESKNIHTIGWIDVCSQEFYQMIENCIGIINPSCAEGASGSVIQCMHAGLIPVVSRESGVNVDDFGIILEECSIEEIQRSVENISSLSESEVTEMSRRAWNFARINHTRVRFAEEYENTINAIIMREKVADVNQCEK
ncbi:MAG: hypothetical protein A2Y81_13155 [Nitrospirae bacterium RBG_13_43_8]|nr:MAG: hypothetical protein A2Y81_13155 [Nitrospirae bacterium RBG_13_43_8]